MPSPIQLILVPQGAEYQTVRRGLQGVSEPPTLLSVPVGPVAMRARLQALQQEGRFANQPKVLMMGLCGSLSPRFSIADSVLYRDCCYRSSPSLPTAACLTSDLQTKLGDRAALVKALTSDRVICSAQEKRLLSQYADVVDMEGYPALEFFRQIGITVAMLRVVSDDCQHDLPDLTAAISPTGSLRPGKMAVGMLRQPIGAVRLIRGSLRSLKVLQQVTRILFA